MENVYTYTIDRNGHFTEIFFDIFQGRSKKTLKG